jgi:hypothetical protein
LTKTLAIERGKFGIMANAVVQLLGDLCEVVTVIGRVAVEVAAIALAGRVARIVDCHGGWLPSTSAAGQERMIACSGQDWAAPHASASWPAGTSSATADE